MSKIDTLRPDSRPSLLQRWRHLWMRTRGDLGIFGFGLRWAVLLLFAVYFFVPILWLVLATSKSAPELLTLNPLAFGSFQRIQEAWQRIIEYQDGEVLLWAFNSIRYAIWAMVLSLAISVPSGLYPGRCTLSRPSPIALVDIDYHVAAGIGSGIAHVYGDESVPFGQHPMGCHFAISLFPIRHILDLYLFRLQPAARPARRGTGRRLF